MKYIKIIGFVVFLAGINSSALCQSAGTTIFEFLKSQYSPRGAAMANNLIAVKGDINAMFYNPAALSGISKSQWAINYVDHLIDFQAGQLAYSRKSGKLGVVSLGLQYFNYGDFEETDIFGEISGRDFSASEFALAASISNALGEGFDYGLNLKFIYSSLDVFSASGAAFDAGIIYSPAYINQFQLGVSVANLGFIVDNYTDFEGKIPVFLRVGFSKRLEHLPLLFSASLNDLTLVTENSTDFIKRFSVGGEFDLSETVKFRIGYDNDINQNVKSLGARTLGGISAGLGIYWKKYRLDYAFSNYGDLGSQNRFGISGSL